MRKEQYVERSKATFQDIHQNLGKMNNHSNLQILYKVAIEQQSKTPWQCLIKVLKKKK